MKLHRVQIYSYNGYRNYDVTTERIITEAVDNNKDVIRILANLIDELNLSTTQILKITESNYEEFTDENN